jgi:hypothetical protein
LVPFLERSAHLLSQKRPRDQDLDQNTGYRDVTKQGMDLHMGA